MNKFSFSKFLFLVLFLIAMVVDSYALKFDRIKVEGNKRIKELTVKAKLGIRPGRDYNDNVLNEAFKRLFDTGYFSDIKLDLRGKTLVVKVKENPIINKIAYEGNSTIEDKIFKEHLSLKARRAYTVAGVKEDVFKIKNMYRTHGYFAAKVTPKIIKLSDNRVNLVYEIEEGKPTKIKRINIVGNKAFKEELLLKVLQTKESAWYRFMGSQDTYDAQRLENDKNLLKQFYNSQGYVDFKVKSSVAELSPDKKSFIITITVEEGDKYKIGKFNFKDEFKRFTKEELMKKSGLKEGVTYNSLLIEHAAKWLTRLYAEKGFAFNKVDTDIKKNEKDKTMDITFTISNGEKIYIRNVIVKGNQRVNIDVIRNQMSLQEGDAYNELEAQITKNNIMGLGFFKGVKVEKQPTFIPDQVDLIVTVDEEKSTGSMNFRGGYSDFEGLSLEIDLNEANLAGKGQDINIAFHMTKTNKNIGFSFTEPFFMNRSLALSFGGSYDREDSGSVTGYKSRSANGFVGLAYKLAPHVYQSIGFSGSRSSFTGVSLNVSKVILNEQGVYRKASLNHNINWRYFDNNVEPTSGYGFGLSTSVIKSFNHEWMMRNVANVKYFRKLPLNMQLSFIFKVGHVTGLGGDTVKSGDMFRLGGETLRGFDHGGVSPRDMTIRPGNKGLPLRSPIGGDFYYNAVTEISFPMPFLPEELRFKGHIFMDVGGVASSKDYSTVIDDVVDANGKQLGTQQPIVVANSASPRVGIGVGVSVVTPFGLMGFDWAVPVFKRKEDVTNRTYLRMGNRYL